MPNVDIDDEFLQILFGVTGSDVPKDINLPRLKQQVTEISELVKTLNTSAKRPSPIKNNENEDEDEPKGPAILVVDDLGVITYQLKVLLSRFEYDVDCSQEIYDAVNKYKKRKYLYVVMDLFIPTEREGFILLTELRKMALSSGTRTVIGVITASPRKEIEQQCKARGADFFLEKSSDWQNHLLEIMDSYINADKKDEEF